MSDHNRDERLQIMLTEEELAALRALLADEDADLGEAIRGPGVQVAVDQAVVRGDVALSDGSEVAFLPPMSGG